MIPRASENDTESINHYINNLKKLNKKLIKISMPIPILKHHLIFHKQWQKNMTFKPHLKRKPTPIEI